MSVVTTSRRRPPRRVPLPAVLVLAAVLLAALALFLLREGRASSRPPSTPPAPSREGPASSGPQEGPSPVPAAPAPSREGPASSGPQEGVSSVPATSISATAPSTPEPFNLSTNSAEDPPPPPPKHFRSPSEQLLALMLSTPPDVAMPPLPQLDPDDARLNADALAAVTNDLVIYDTDGEDLESLKENVAGVKFQLADAVSKGVSVAEALNEFREHQNEGVEIRNETIKAINSIEDDQAAAETFKKANEELEKEDILPIRPEEVGFESAP